jgi:hypothetical protein
MNIHCINRHGIRGVAFAATLAVTSISAPSSATAANFDGNWVLVSKTTKGHCGVAQWNVAISGGRIYYPGGFFMGFPVGFGGAVSPSGRLRVTVVAGPRVGIGAGRLSNVRGSGTWSGKGPSGTCSGVWTAARVAGSYAPVPWAPFGAFPQRR